MARWMFGMVVAVPVAISAQAPQPLPPAQAAQTAQGDVAVTIYGQDVALVQDRRQLNLPAGLSRQEFPDVSSKIRPETVSLSAAGTEVVEQNYDYDLLSPNALMEKAVGQTITIVRTNPATGAETREQARVLSSNEGVILQIGNRIEILRDDGLPVRVVFDSFPPNLRARPTLSITVAAKSAGSRPVTLSYLTGGLSWSADYVALFDEAKSSIDVQGWITLANEGGASYVNADTVLVAGGPGGAAMQGQGIAPGTRAGTETAARARLGDFYLYPLGHRTTIAANQQKQVSFLSASAIPARKLYAFRNRWLRTTDEARSADTVLGFSTSRAGGLGDALPGGTVRVYIRDAKGQPQFVGEDQIGHTPMGSELAIKTGEAFDVKVKAVLDKREKILADEWERTARYRIRTSGAATRTVIEERNVTYWRTAMRYVLTNARPTPVMVEVSQSGLDNGWGDTRVPMESQPGEQRSLDERVWRVSVPANGSATLTATFDTRY